MQPKNLLILLSDEHQRAATGCYGNTIAKTPNLDALAERGTRFTNAYTSSPVCVPARASLMTGRYVHEIGCWDNAAPYHGHVESWAHRCRDNGHQVTSIGKLHFRSTDDDNGLSEEILPLHVVNGIGDLLGIIRNPPVNRGEKFPIVKNAHAGDSSYSAYDISIADEAEKWLIERGRKPDGKPWILMVSFVRPHFPLIAPREFFDLYKTNEIPLPKHHRKWDLHPILAALKESSQEDTDSYTDDQIKNAIHCYLALVSFMDHNVGRVVKALKTSGLENDTRIIYASDHGENLGVNGLWAKSSMNEESAGIPIILAGPDVIPAVVETPVSICDVYKTALDAVGIEQNPGDPASSFSLWDIARGEKPKRDILSEYHAYGAMTGIFMLRHERWKYIKYEGFGCELYDLQADPDEEVDLAKLGGHEDVIAQCDEALKHILDPRVVNQKAFSDQAERLRHHGGVDAILNQGSDFGYTPAPGETIKRQEN